MGREVGRTWVSSQGLGTRFIVPSMNSPQLLPHNNLSTGALIDTYCLVGGYCCMKGTLLGKISQEPTQHLPHHEKLVGGGGNFPVSSRLITLCLSTRVNIPDTVWFLHVLQPVFHLFFWKFLTEPGAYRLAKLGQRASGIPACPHPSVEVTDTSGCCKGTIELN